MRRKRGDRDGAEQAFRDVYERMQPRTVAVARRLVADGGVAEDLAAEAFARAYARWSSVQQHPNPDAWLMRVVGNLAVDHVRHEARRPDLRDDAGRSDHAGERAALRVDLAAALHRLSNRQQEVVVMRYLIDLTEEDVAVSLGMSTGSVKTHLHRATTKLRAELTEDELPAEVTTHA